MPPHLYAILYLYAWIVLSLCLCPLRCHEICSKQCLYTHDSVCYVVNSVYVIYDSLCYVVNSVCIIYDSVGYVVNSVCIIYDSVGYVVNSVCIIYDSVGYVVNSVCIIYDSVGYVVTNRVWKMLPEHINFQCRPLKKRINILLFEL